MLLCASVFFVHGERDPFRGYLLNKQDGYVKCSSIIIIYRWNHEEILNSGVMSVMWYLTRLFINREHRDFFVVLNYFEGKNVVPRVLAQVGNYVKLEFVETYDKNYLFKNLQDRMWYFQKTTGCSFRSKVEYLFRNLLVMFAGFFDRLRFSVFMVCRFVLFP